MKVHISIGKIHMLGHAYVWTLCAQTSNTHMHSTDTAHGAVLLQFLMVHQFESLCEIFYSQTTNNIMYSYI